MAFGGGEKEGILSMSEMVNRNRPEVLPFWHNFLDKLRIRQPQNGNY